MAQFDTLNSEEVIATTIRGLKQFIQSRGDKINALEIPEPKIKKDEAATEAEKTYLLNFGHKKGYMDALRDIRSFIINTGM